MPRSIARRKTKKAVAKRFKITATGKILTSQSGRRHLAGSKNRKRKRHLAKKEKDTKKNSSATKLKELNFHMNIDEHDYSVKMRHAEEFMWKGMKVKLQLKFRGREMMHQDIGMNLIRRMRSDLGTIGVADTEPKLIGKSINLMLSPLPARKRVRKFSHEDEPPQEEESTDSSPENGNGSE